MIVNLPRLMGEGPEQDDIAVGLASEPGETAIPVNAATLESHSCVNQVIMQLRYATLTEEQGVELLNETIDFLMNSGWFERDGARHIAAGVVPPFIGIEE